MPARTVTFTNGMPAATGPPPIELPPDLLQLPPRQRARPHRPLPHVPQPGQCQASAQQRAYLPQPAKVWIAMPGPAVPATDHLPHRRQSALAVGQVSADAAAPRVDPVEVGGVLAGEVVVGKWSPS